MRPPTIASVNHLTGQSTYPYSSTWNEFLDLLGAAKKAGHVKQVRHRPTEYHYLVKNKRTGTTLTHL